MECAAACAPVWPRLRCATSLDRYSASACGVESPRLDSVRMVLVVIGPRRMASFVPARTRFHRSIGVSIGPLEESYADGAFRSAARHTDTDITVIVRSCRQDRRGTRIHPP